MWEWFTTKPFVDAGEVRFVRHLIAPSPCVTSCQTNLAHKQHRFNIYGTYIPNDNSDK